MNATSLTRTEQDAVLDALGRGASPAMACRQIGRSIGDFFHTVNFDAEFKRRVLAVDVTLGQNVAAALYKAAMEGSVTAQTFWLRNCPPPGWQSEKDKTMTDPFENLTDEELIELARAQGIALPPEIESRTESPAGEEVPKCLSQEPEADE